MPERRRLRRYLVGSLVVLFSLSAVASTVALWARAQILNTDRWTELAGEVIRDPEVVDALSTRLSSSIVNALAVEDRVRNALVGAERLPAQATLLAGPLTSRIQDFLEGRIEAFLSSEGGQRLWLGANRAAHQRIVAVLRGETRTGVTVEGGTVTLNTIPLIDRGLARAQELLSDILGRPVTLPSAAEITASGTADRARQLLEERLGVELPEDFGELVVFSSERLAEAQDAVRLLDRFVVLLVVTTILLVAASLAFSLARRRTLIQLGVGLLVAALLARVVIRAVQDRIVGLAAEPSRDAVGSVARDVFGGFLDSTTFLIVAGIVVGMAAYMAGRPAWLVRLGDGVRTPAASARLERFGRWAREHRDGLRLGGVVTAVVVLYLVELSWFSVAVILLLLAAYEVGISYALAPGPAVSERSSTDTGPPVDR